MNNNDNTNMLYSWPVILIALSFFWPVGIYLIIKRTSSDKKAALSAGKFIGGIGIVLYVIAALYLLPCLPDQFNSFSVGVIVFFAAAGFALRLVARKIRKEAELVRKYLSIIVNGEVRQLDAIASTIGKSYDSVKSDVQEMIDKGYLKNAYINEGTREVVLTNHSAVVQNTEYSVSSTENRANTSAAASQPRIVMCKCCGARNVIEGVLGECEYCGVPIK